MHFLGLAGMPRRIPDYATAYSNWNLIASYGSYLSAISSVFFFVVVYHTLVHGEPVQRKNVWL
jgi:cytochrome c oxidase subunit 1